MIARDLACALAICAALVQLAAVATAIRIARHHRLQCAGAAVVGALGLMALRRLLAAATLTGHAGAAGPSVLQELAGLAISVIVLAAIAGLKAPLQAQPASAMSHEPDLVPAADVAGSREEERELLCYDLHDGLAQLVLGARMHLDTFRTTRQEDADHAEQQLGVAAQRLEEASDEVTQLVSRLAVGLSEDVALSDAVSKYVMSLAESHGWQVEIDDRLNQRRFDPAIEVMTYRVVQEALTNAAKHAHTDRVKVSLHVEDGALVAAVQDWGRGFDPDQVQWQTRRLGLRGMCRRASFIGGTCHVESRPGEGARIVMTIPGITTGGDGA